MKPQARLLCAALLLLLTCVAPTLAAAAVLPTWTTTVTDPLVDETYPLTFVGTDPRLGQTTTVPTLLIALDLRFPNGRVMAGSRDVGLVALSPIFNPLTVSPVDGQVGQYGDWLQRAQFGQIGTSYHLLLAPPAVRTLQLTVPAGVGDATVNSRGVLVGEVDLDWLDGQLQQTIRQLHVPVSTLPILLTHNVFAYHWSPANCCIMGYHNAVGQPVRHDSRLPADATPAQKTTYVYSAYITPRSFRDYPAVGISDVNALSHELSEWLNDPFVTNIVEPWVSPLAPQYGCSPWFETGDPLVGASFEVPGNPARNAGSAWHLQDEAFLNWFVHDGQDAALTPADGRYTYLNRFPVASTGC